MTDRYALKFNGGRADFFPVEDGPWVRYDDHQTLIEARDFLKEQYAKALEKIVTLERENAEWRSAARLMVKGEVDEQRKAWAALAHMIDLVDGPE